MANRKGLWLTGVACENDPALCVWTCGAERVVRMAWQGGCEADVHDVLHYFCCVHSADTSIR